MRNLLIILIALFTSFNFSFSQFLSGKDAQVLLKGVIKDENTNIALAVSIEFRSKEGKKIKTFSSKDGKFEQLLPSGEEYLVILSSDDIIRKEFNFKIDDVTKFTEQETEWTAIKPDVGARIFYENIFSNGSANIDERGLEKLQELQKLLRFNRSLYVDFNISNLENLANQRISELNKLVDSWTREKARITIKVASNPKQEKDFSVYITKISDFLNK